jgi:hypothetical protein
MGVEEARVRAAEPAAAAAAAAAAAGRRARELYLDDANVHGCKSPSSWTRRGPPTTRSRGSRPSKRDASSIPRSTATGQFGSRPSGRGCGRASSSVCAGTTSTPRLRYLSETVCHHRETALARQNTSIPPVVLRSGRRRVSRPAQGCSDAARGHPPGRRFSARTPRGAGDETPDVESSRRCPGLLRAGRIEVEARSRAWVGQLRGRPTPRVIRSPWSAATAAPLRARSQARSSGRS